MSGSVNKVILVGNLGTDPETRYSQSGAPICNLRLATNEQWKDRSGNSHKRTEWHRVVTFGKLAENCRDYLTSGRQVYIEGRIQTRSWEDQNGNTRYVTEVVAKIVQFLGGGRSTQTQQQESSAKPDLQNTELEVQSTTEFNAEDV